MGNMTLLNAFLETETSDPDRDGIFELGEKYIIAVERIASRCGCSASLPQGSLVNRGQEFTLPNVTLRFAFTGSPLGVARASKQLEDWVRRDLRLHSYRAAWFDDQVIWFVIPPAKSSEWEFIPNDYVTGPFSIGSDDGILATGFKSRVAASNAVFGYGGWTGLDDLRVFERPPLACNPWRFDTQTVRGPADRLE
ncbi:hypothetical protein [Rosistilla oblonga]|uniref:hypothetical protein n=1 Tax=Rosistilla oblonga TaxID=2527990 RepID=UPI003A96D335